MILFLANLFRFFSKPSGCYLLYPKLQAVSIALRQIPALPESLIPFRDRRQPKLCNYIHSRAGKANSGTQAHFLRAFLISSRAARPISAARPLPAAKGRKKDEKNTPERLSKHGGKRFASHEKL
jgi:hypothetical protein